MDDKMSEKGQKNFFYHPSTQKSHLNHVYRSKKSKKRNFGHFSDLTHESNATPPTKEFHGGGITVVISYYRAW